MRVASIDIGTNSVLLLVAEARGRELVPIAERATVTRLGQGVDLARALAPDACERTLACLARYAEEIRLLGAERVDVVGTSAMRDANGGEAFRERAGAILGVVPRVISGEEEAALTFAGALAGLPVIPGDELHAPTIVFDVGGGSTELIRRAGAGPLDTVSLDVGSVRLTERHVRSDPPRPEELDAVRADVRAALATTSRDGRSRFSDPSARVIGVAGTVTTIAAFARGIAPYDPSRIHGLVLTAAEIAAAGAALAAMPLEARRKLAEIDPARADILVAGCTLVEELLAWTAVEPSVLTVSDRGVRWGLAQQLIEASTEASLAP